MDDYEEENKKWLERYKVHPCRPRLHIAHTEEGHHVTLTIDPSIDRRLAAQLPSDLANPSNLMNSVLETYGTPHRHEWQSHQDVRIEGNSIKWRLSQDLPDDWVESSHQVEPAMIANAYESHIKELMDNHYQAHDFKEMMEIISSMLWSSTPDHVAALTLPKQHPEELDAIDHHLKRKGLSQYKLLAIGGMTAVLVVQDKYVVRVINKAVEYARPVAPQILQPIDRFETEHYRIEVLPKLAIQGVTTQHVDYVSSTLRTGWEHPDNLVIFEDAKARNVGLLPDGTPLVLDPGKSFTIDTSDSTPIPLNRYKSHAEILEWRKEQAIEASKKHSWVDENGLWKQHRFFPEILSGLPDVTGEHEMQPKSWAGKTSKKFLHHNPKQERSP